MVKFYTGYHSKVIEPGIERQRERLEGTERQDVAIIVEAITVHNWTADMQAQAISLWEATREKWTIPAGRRQFYLSIYKTCLFHAKCTPWDIVGVRNRLVFKRHVGAGPNAASADPFQPWSAPFCERLDLLVTHPAWVTGQRGGRAAALALAIQYAVILRINDQRELDFKIRDPFLTELQDLHKTGMPIREAHARARALELQRGTYMSIFCISNVLLALERVVNTPKEPAAVDHDDYYYVTSDDLANLIQALDSIVDPDTETVSLSTEMYYKTALSIRPRAQPSGVEALRALHAQAMLEESRRVLGHRLYLGNSQCVDSVEADNDASSSHDSRVWPLSSDDGEFSVGLGSESARQNLAGESAHAALEQCDFDDGGLETPHLAQSPSPRIVSPLPLLLRSAELTAWPGQMSRTPLGWGSSTSPPTSPIRSTSLQPEAMADLPYHGGSPDLGVSSSRL